MLYPSFPHNIGLVIIKNYKDVAAKAKMVYYVLLLDHNRTIGLMSRVFANGPGERGSISGRVILKIRKMIFDVTLLSTQHY